MLSRDYTMLVDKKKNSHLGKYQKNAESIKNLQKFGKLTKSNVIDNTSEGQFKNLINSDKPTTNNLLKTNNSFNYNCKVKNFDPNDIRLGSSLIDKVKSQSQNNIKKHDKIEAIKSNITNIYNGKLGQNMKNFIDEKCKILNKNNQNNNNPKYLF